MEEILKKLMGYDSDKLYDLKNKLEKIIHNKLQEEKEYNISKVIKKFSKEDLERCFYLMDKMEEISKREYDVEFKKKIKYKIYYGIMFKISDNYDSSPNYNERDIIKKINNLIIEEAEGYNKELLEICKRYGNFDYQFETIINYVVQYRKMIEENIKEIIE